MSDQGIDDRQMTVSSHLEELQRRLILTLIGVAVAACVMLVFGKYLVALLCRPLNHAQTTLGLAPQTYTHSPPTGFTVYLKVSLAAGLMVASPWVVYQGWRFIASGLRRSERRIALTLVPFSTVMMIAGILFLYFVMLPVCLWFLLAFASSYPDVGGGEPSLISRLLAQASGPAHAAPDPGGGVDPDPVGSPGFSLPILTKDPTEPRSGQIWLKVPELVLRFHAQGKTRSIVPGTTNLMSPLIEIGQYISFVTMLAIGIVVAFQLPVVMLVLGWSGIVAPDWFAQYRRHCVFVCFVLGALLTPADLPSMFLLALPLWGLFEMGLVLMRAVYSKEATDSAQGE